MIMNLAESRQCADGEVLLESFQTNYSSVAIQTAG